MSNSSIIYIIAAIFTALFFALLPTDMAAIVLDELSSWFISIAFVLPHSRQKESEADSVGIMLAARVYLFI